MNVGGNIEYYLKKGFRVIGIDANPQLVDLVRSRFAASIDRGDLTVLNVGVAPTEGTLPFYVNKRQSGLSSFAAPDVDDGEWAKIEVPVKTLSALIRQYGYPAFVKIDVEGFDAAVVRDLMLNHITPPSISVEAHGLQAVCCLVAMGYTDFQLVNCAKIGVAVADQPVSTLQGSLVPHRFEKDSAGPFGDDLHGDWSPGIEMMVKWFGKRLFLGAGWYDVHARNPKSSEDLTSTIADDDRLKDVTRSLARAALASAGRRIKPTRHSDRAARRA
jgi:FkbM family methyltransferase